MFFRTFCLLSLLMAPLSAGAEVLKLQDIQEGGIFFRYVSMPEAEFTVARCTNLARNFMEAAGAPRFASMSMTAPGGVLPHFTHQRYTTWLHMRPRALQFLRPQASVTVMGENAVLRIRDREGEIGRVVLRGTDPLIRNVSGNTFEILHITFEGTEQHGRIARAFVRTNVTLDEELGRAVTAELKESFPDHMFSVWFRKDIWFVEHDDFPYVYPYDPVSEPISAEEYLKTSAFRCSVRTTGISCQSWPAEL